MHSHEEVMITGYSCFSSCGCGAALVEHFTPCDFARRFHCPDAVLAVGHGYVDADNVYENDRQHVCRLAWIFMGITAHGQPVRGEGAVHIGER